MNITFTSSFQLKRDSFGRLVLTTLAGEIYTGIIPVRAFPIFAPDDGIGILNEEGHEVAWVDRISDLPSEISILLLEELASREFMPELKEIIKVSSFTCPSTWDIETQRGLTTLVLRGEEDIRRLSQFSLLIADSHGIQFLIRDMKLLNRHSRHLLDRFL